MPRIRKKSSNRQNTRDRAKITRKVSEHKKKSKRDGKRNPQKSKKKDPGVPNSFHLKDQVLAQMAAEKRQTHEAKMAARGKRGDESDDEDAPGVSSMAGSVVTKPLSGVSSLPVVAEPTDVPELLDSDLPTLQAALDAADVLLEVVDARDVQGSRSAHVENLVAESGAQVWIVLNKADLVPREALEGWLNALPFPAFVFSSRAGWGKEELLAALGQLKKSKGGEVKAALLGLPNVGKSSVANTLVGRDQFKVAPIVPLNAAARHPAPTTSLCSEVEITTGINIIDTPGWEYVEDSDDEDEEVDEELDVEDEAKWDALEARVAGDLLRRNLGRVDKVKDVYPLANYIISRSNPQDLMLKYNVPYFEAGDIAAFLTGLARVNKRVKKHGDPDHDGAARILLRDWATGGFPYYTMPPKGGMEVETERPAMGTVLALCKTRKELRAGGLVKFQASQVDTREVFLDDDFTAVDVEGMNGDEEEEDELDELEGEEDEDEDEDDEDEEDDGVLIGSDEGEELALESGPEPSSPSSLDEEEEDSDSDSPEPAPASRKRKAAATSPDVRKKAKVSKSVSFQAKPAPKSAPRAVKEVKSILKVKEVPSPAPAPREEAKVASKAENRREKRAAVAQPPSEARKPLKKTKLQPAPKAKATTAVDGEAYDFAKHF